MNNLEELGVQELNAAEMKKINGGIWGALAWVVSTLAIASLDSPDDFKEGYESVRKNYY